jgi:hypothetical protein
MFLQDLQHLETLQTLLQGTRCEEQQGRKSDGTKVTLFLRLFPEAKYKRRNQAAYMTP